MCICVRLFVYVSVNENMHKIICVYMQVSEWVYTCLYVGKHASMHLCVYTVCVHGCVCVSVHVCAHSHAYMCMLHLQVQ